MFSGGFFIPKNVVAQEPFQAGEAITYNIAYHWGFIWVNAGEVTFSVDTLTYLNKPAFKFTGVGHTYEKYDWFYKVRDKYESISAKNGLYPYVFTRDVNEGSNHFSYHYTFNHSEKTAKSTLRKPNEEPIIKYQNLNRNVHDVLSLVYVMRFFDFDSLQKNDTIGVDLILDNKVHHSTVLYLGKEMVIDEFAGAKLCYVLKPSLVEGTIFAKGDEMMVYVTADENKIPIQVNSPILVGNIQARIKKVKGLKKPL